MNLTPIFADLPASAVVIVAAVLALVMFLQIVVIISRYARVGPNQALVVSGRQHKYVGPDGTVRKRGFRIVKGGGTFVYPVVEKADVLPLDVLAANIQIHGVYSADNLPLTVDGVAQIKIKSDDESLAAAAEHFLKKTPVEIRSFATQIVDARLRSILRTMSFDAICRNLDEVAARTQRAASAELADTGLTVISLTIREVHNSQNQPIRQVTTSDPPPTQN
ncbi:MAG TPA: flotillin family protein [Candidatus Acidoferrum sp.]|jgi:flotillin|nr:flotillin family protein [Candidatus Acidoferrum sp.]